jgi:hypothetical protein
MPEPDERRDLECIVRLVCGILIIDGRSETQEILIVPCTGQHKFISPFPTQLSKLNAKLGDIRLQRFVVLDACTQDDLHTVSSEKNDATRYLSEPIAQRGDARHNLRPELFRSLAGMPQVVGKRIRLIVEDNSQFGRHKLHSIPCAALPL